MKIYVVGIGPGGEEQMTAAAREAIDISDVIVGYSKYIELLDSLIDGKEIFTSVMKQEKERCEKALEYCIQGKTVQSGRNFYDQCSKGGSGEVGPPDCGI